MKIRILVIIIVLPMFLISCKKESVPDKAYLKGEWEEVNNLLDKQILVFVDQDTVYFSKTFSRFIGPPDTLLYRLNNNFDMIFFRSATDPGSGESAHKIKLDSKNNELTVWNLLISVPESPSVTIFKKQ